MLKVYEFGCMCWYIYAVFADGILQSAHATICLHWVATSLGCICTLCTCDTAALMILKHDCLKLHKMTWDCILACTYVTYVHQ